MTSSGHLEGAELRGALVSACDYVQGIRVELNRINVFPVPDGDTGTNLALTAASIAHHLRRSTAESTADVARAAAEAGVLGARGNCGMILSHFLLGLADGIGDRARLTVAEFVDALRHAVEHVYRSLERPVEGTMLTIMRAIADEGEKRRHLTFHELLEGLVASAREALARTPELLPVLKKAGVVDAGAKGFVHLLEGLVAYLAGDPLVAATEPAPGTESPFAAGMAEYPTDTERYRFCTEGLVRGDALPEADEVRAYLREQGDSLVVIRAGELLKIHIHTDEPERIFTYLRGFGTLAAHKAEDMQVQHAHIERAANAGELARRPVSFVADSACDLPEAVVRAHGIHLVPLNLIVDDQTLRDGVDISAEGYADLLVQGVHPTTSQPAPAAFLDAYGRAAGDGEEIIAVLLASALSGTFASAEAAAKRFDAAPVHLVDSRGASLTQGMLVLRAAELAELGWKPREIVEELQRIRGQSGILFTLESYDRLIASGRVGRGRAFFGSLLDIKPILSLDREGKVEPLGRVRGSRNVLPRMMEMLMEATPDGVERLRFGVIHVAAPESAERAVEALRATFGEREIFVSTATPVIATHTGPGTWGIAYQVEDGAPERLSASAPADQHGRQRVEAG